MTTEAAAKLYEWQHVSAHRNLTNAIFNPHNKPVDTLPFIFGFNNNGADSCLEALLLAEDGTCLGGHLCSSEAYMPADLGILEGTREDRHEGFRKHYPDGYGMEFVASKELATHAGLNAALKLAREQE